MGEVLNQEQIDSIETCLMSDKSGEFLDLMKSLSLRERVEICDEQVIALARRTDLVQLDEKGQPQLTDLGWKVSDTIREYCFWVARDRKLHEAGRSGSLDGSVFEGKRILEIGSGFGCNLFTLQPCAAHVVGVEIEPVYIQMTPLLAGMEGIKAPLVLSGNAERLEFEDASQDVVIAFGSMQFMDLHEVLREITRVLDANGMLISVMSSLGQFVKYEAVEAFRSRDWKRIIRAVLVFSDTHHYQIRGKRLPWLTRSNPMNKAVYPTRRAMERFLLDAGLTPDAALSVDNGHERTFIARKV